MQPIEAISGVWSVTGDQPGSTVMIMGGVHGNETVGVKLVEHLRKGLAVERGRVYVVLANQPAVEQGVRLLGKNLNRCFMAGNTGGTVEDRRAQELMPLLDECEALLDVHAFNDSVGEPFIICEEPAVELAVKLGAAIVTTGWNVAEPGGSDGYMFERGKLGICYECGPATRPDDYVPVAQLAVQRFLQWFGLVPEKVPYATNQPRRIELVQSVKRTSQDFFLNPELKSFQPLQAGQILGKQAGQEFVASSGEIIIFPRPQAKIGAEAYLIGQEVIGSPLSGARETCRVY